MARHAAYIDQQLHDLAHSDPNYFAAHFQGIDGQTLLTADFFDVVMVFGLADGSLEPSATALSLVALLWCYVDPAMATAANALALASYYAKIFMENHPRPTLQAPSCMNSFSNRDQGNGTEDGKAFRSLLFELAMAAATADGVVTTNEDQSLRRYAFLLDTSNGTKPLRRSILEGKLRDVPDDEPPPPWVHVQAARGFKGPSKSYVQASTARTMPQSELEPASRDTPRPADLVQSRSVESLLAELNGLIGLGQVKAEVIRLASFLQVEQLRKSRGLKPSDISLHMEFYGNPGTGKTTTARLIAQIYRALGFLSRGHLVEADRAKLVGGYLGQTAIKTSEVIEQALGGVLFIDEAYSLARGDSNHDLYGAEAIATILKNMEDHRDDLVVIVAGYPAEMAAFMASNPGLKSRFNRFINFEDYIPEELFQIFRLFASKAQYRISTTAAEKLRDIFEDGFKGRDGEFGNGRFARNLFECSIQQLASRIVSIPQVTDEALTTIEAIDIPDAESVSPTPRKVAPIGFEVPK
ncbi:MAG: AAA family ATPase [Candidatus Sulfotelmatobacter sp.]